MKNNALWIGGAFGLAAGMLWGLVFVTPLLLPHYPAWMLSMSRYLAFGLIALPLAWFDRRGLAQLSRGDWVEALKLSLVGNLAYYACLAAAIQRAGGPVPTMIIGTLPVVIAVVTQLQARRALPDERANSPVLRWRSLLPSLVLIALGLLCVNQVEWARFRAESDGDLRRYALGALLAAAAVACWTWYPIRNAQWLRTHPDRSSRVWATAQGLATLPLAGVGFALFWGYAAWQLPDWPMPWGDQPLRFVGLMLAVGLMASWLGTLCWNEASQRLPPTVSGQLIVFETLAALTYAWLLRGQWPDALTLIGAALLLAGVLWALNTGRR